MKWITQERVHVDRVACPWLIKRFIDPNAEFKFIHWPGTELKPEKKIDSYLRSSIIAIAEK